jgi:hypothetical protein
MLYALGCHKLNGFGPLNRAVQLASASRIASGAVSHFTSTLFTTEIVGALKVMFCSSTASFSAAGFISAQWDGTLTGSGSARLAPAALQAAPALNGFFVAGDNHLARRVKVTGETTCPSADSSQLWQ